ncbi:MAG TPA: hypothetical protein VKZ60_18350 [Chloroflexota bacterium]|nr:hypothetical protein [Chloroflexota bacterium]
MSFVECVVDLLDPALWVALALGVLLVVLLVRLQPPPLPPPRCERCGLAMERREQIIDPEHPEHRFIRGVRVAWFACPRCGARRRAHY